MEAGESEVHSRTQVHSQCDTSLSYITLHLGEQGGKLYTWFAFKFWFYSCWCDFSFYVFLMSIRWGYFVGYHIWVGGGGNGYYTHSVKSNTWCRMNTPCMLTKPSRWITRNISLSHAIPHSPHAIPASLFYNTQIKKNLLTLHTSVPEWKQRHTGVWFTLHALLLHIVLYSHWSLLHVYVCGMSSCAYECLHVCGRMW